MLNRPPPYRLATPDHVSQDGWTRTSALVLPRHAGYQTSPRPETQSTQWESNPRFRHGEAAGYRYIMGAWLEAELSKISRRPGGTRTLALDYHVRLQAPGFRPQGIATPVAWSLEPVADRVMHRSLKPDDVGSMPTGPTSADCPMPVSGLKASSNWEQHRPSAQEHAPVIQRRRHRFRNAATRVRVPPGALGSLTIRLPTKRP